MMSKHLHWNMRSPNSFFSGLAIWIAACGAALSLGVCDWSVYASMKNDEGVELKDMISDFKRYQIKDVGKQKITVVIVGCVARPGVYEISSGETFENFVKRAGLISIKQHTAHSFIKGVVLFRGDEDRKIDLEEDKDKGLELKDGDVINVKCVVI